MNCKNGRDPEARIGTCFRFENIKVFILQKSILKKLLGITEISMAIGAYYFRVSCGFYDIHIFLD